MCTRSTASAFVVCVAVVASGAFMVGCSAPTGALGHEARGAPVTMSADTQETWISMSSPGAACGHAFNFADATDTYWGVVVDYDQPSEHWYRVKASLIREQDFGIFQSALDDGDRLTLSWDVSGHMISLTRT